MSSQADAIIDLTALEALPLDRPVIHGHSPRAEPLDTGHVIAIDTDAARLLTGD